MAGLYSKNNLGEVQLNLKDALQKLYETGIQEDLRLFAFANAVYSEVRSGVTKTNFDTGAAEVIDNEIKGLVNKPFTNENGTVVKRTKFVTTQFTFSTNNLVYFEKITVPGFDQRQQFRDTILPQAASAGDTASQIKLGLGPAVEVGDRLIASNSEVFYVLDGAPANTSFRISRTTNGTEITGAALVAVRDTLTTSAKVRKTGPEGAPVVISENGSIVSATVTGAGSGYEVERTDRPGSFEASTVYKILTVGSFDWTSIGGPTEANAAVGVSFTSSADVSGQDSTKSGTAVRSLDTSTAKSVDVNVIGERSGASNAVLRVKILNGKLSRTDLIDVIDGGSGYYSDEPLKIVEQCRLNRFGQQGTPQLQKCKNYSDFQDRLIHRSFKYTVPTGDNEIDYSTAVLGYEGALVSSEYFYETRDAGEDGFSLYDPRTQLDLYLGETYDVEFSLPNGGSTPALLMRRFDTITSLNLLNLDSLSAQSRINDYDDNVFSVADTLASQLRGLTESVDSIRDLFKTLMQNNTRQRLVSDAKNTLGTQFNIFEGRNFDSTFRLIFRDPDDIVDRSDVTFGILSAMDNQDGIETTIGSETLHVPGIWIKTGVNPEYPDEALYKRAFSTDDKPFSSSRGRVVLSPILNKLSSGDYSTGTFVSATDADPRYSISTAYLLPGGAYVQGFTSNIGTIVQNLSASPRNGGFVYHRTLSTQALTTDQGAVIGYPLFDYVDTSGTLRNPYILVEQGVEEDL